MIVAVKTKLEVEITDFYEESTLVGVDVGEYMRSGLKELIQDNLNDGAIAEVTLSHFEQQTIHQEAEK